MNNNLSHPELAASHLHELVHGRFVILGGKGGVGRTTTAAMLGLAVAKAGKKVLITTTGLDDRLAWMMDESTLVTKPARVRENLWVQRLVPQVCIREYGALVLGSDRIAAAALDNRVVARLFRAIPGLDDFAVLGKAWHEAMRGGAYDVVIFDGPASGHLRFLLGVPQAILQTVRSGPLVQEAKLMQSHLQNSQAVQVILVGLPETWPLTELGELRSALRQELGIFVSTMIINGIWPTLELPTFPVEDEAVNRLLGQTNSLCEVGRRQRRVIHEWAAPQTPMQLLGVPWRFSGISRLAELEAVSRATWKMDFAPKPE